jgi:hypothetical protein
MKGFSEGVEGDRIDEVAVISQIVTMALKLAQRKNVVIERRQLLRDEQDLLAIDDAGGDQVGNRLGLAGAGRALRHSV